MRMRRARSALPLRVPIRLSFGAPATLASRCGRRRWPGADRARGRPRPPGARPEEAMLGAGGHEIDAISVTLVSSKVLESRDLTQMQPTAAAASNAVEATDGATDKEPAVAGSSTRRRGRRRRHGRRKSPRRSRSAPPRRSSRCRRRRSPSAKQQAAAPAAGGGEARSDTASNANASAPAAASAGAVREYAHNVAQALRKTKPRGAGAIGHGAGEVRGRFGWQRHVGGDRQIERQPEAGRHRRSRRCGGPSSKRRRWG